MSIKSKTLIDKIRRNNPYFEDFITRSVYHSNAIEGNTLSFAETYALIFNNRNNIRVNATPRDIYEAINLKYAMSFLFSTLDKALSLDLTKQLGIYINKNINDIDGFRKTQVYIQGVEHIPPSPRDVVRLLSELFYSKAKLADESLFVYLSRFHIDFERIHPFSDGNGRVGRLLITRELLKRGKPPLVIPVDYRGVYMELIANQDIGALANYLQELNDFEVERMRQFGIKL